MNQEINKKYVGKFFHLPVDVDRKLTEISINECVGLGALLQQGANLVLKKYKKGENNDDHDND